MLKAKWLGAVCAATTLALLAPGVASAQPANKRTLFTFSGTVEMPGVSLPAGKYEFRIANEDTSRDIIQVRSADGKKSYGLFTTHQSERVTPANDAEVRFMEAAAGTPPAIRTWWYPGERTGYEFVYPKQQARRIAQRTRQNVLTTKSETTTEPQTSGAELSRVTPAGADAAVSDSQVAEATPSGTRQAGERADSGSLPDAGPQAVATNRTRLPQTASNTPSIALIGILLLAAAGVSRLRRTLSVQ